MSRRCGVKKVEAQGQQCWSWTGETAKRADKAMSVMARPLKVLYTGKPWGNGSLEGGSGNVGRAEQAGFDVL